MSAAILQLSHASALVTYLWHYMLARLLYDELVRPMLHGHVPVILIVAAGVGLLSLLGWRGRRGWPGRRGQRVRRDRGHA